MNKSRDWNIVDDELNRKLKHSQELKSSLDDQSAELLLQNKDQNQEYNNDINYYKEFWRYYLLNEMTIKKVNELHTQNQKLHDLIAEIDVNIYGNTQKLQQELHQALSYRQKKKNRRTSQEIEKSFICPYEKCNKQYGSDVSLNLHIKLKHDGGNKTDREKFAKMIIEAQQNGETITDLNINIKFPPGYLDVQFIQLQQFKTQFLLNQQNQLNQERQSIEQD
ncbi:unnamed protein product (macronuclear) [Paramecium tetraurelia]|uniref:C2H2-type domain-containing protein n=1 Tax=Paramecium tetraurelia TaxID=5888 RepID=A0E0B5_PARTE|nr:uncharacterized protein GSPATT00021900001 [Paramecium tetraurelia]CAK88732.1 unnamed protein product [Paramecium tetraurelia]|eukprot:XP_001456129.1 hypothetical protein (macronuclear) [Paramecium tetraurelia strain d4-2]